MSKDKGNVSDLMKNGFDKKLGKNLLLSMGYNILTVIVPFITAPYLSRVLGAEKVGSYTYVQAIASYFVMFGILGMRAYGNRAMAQVREDRSKRSKVFWEIVTMQFITAGVSTICYFICAPFIYDTTPSLSYIMGLYVISSIFTIDWLCEGLEHFSSLAKRTIIIKLLTLICVFAFIKNQNDLVAYAIIMSTGYLLSAVFLWVTIKKDVDFIKPKLSHIIKHFKPNILLFIPMIAASIYQTMDKIMIGNLANESQLAYYEYAEKITQIPILLYTSIGAVMLSRMSNLFSKKNESNKAINTISYSMDMTFAIGSLLGFGLAATANELVEIYYGHTFAQSGPILMTLTPMILFYGWANVLRMQYVIPNNLNYIYISSTIAGAIVNLLLNMILIPKYQAFGATIGTLAAQLVVALIFSFCVRKKLPLWSFLKRILPVIAIGLISGLTVFYFSKLHPVELKWLIIDVIIGVIIFGILYIIYGFNTRNNLANTIVASAKRKISKLLEI